MTNDSQPVDLLDLIPGDAIPSAVLIPPDTRAVKQCLIETVDADVPCNIVDAYATVLLRLWSIDGRPTAASVLMRGEQKASRRWPLSTYLLWLIVLDAARREQMDNQLPQARKLIRRLKDAICAPDTIEAFPVLRHLPDNGKNDLYRFHQEVHPLRIYPRIAARAHRFLVRRLNEGKDISRWLTPLTRISEAFEQRDTPPPPAYRLDHNEPEVRRLHCEVQAIVADLPNTFAPGQGLADTTQIKYVHQFMSALDIAGFEFQGRDLILTPGPRQSPPSLDELDTDPPARPGDPLTLWPARFREESEQEDIYLEEPLPDDLAGLATEPALEGQHPDDLLRRRAYVRQRATMHHDFPSTDWASLPLSDLARGYSTLLTGAASLSDLDLAAMARLLLYHLLVVTGRPWRWLLSASVGPTPKAPDGYPQPIPEPGHVVLDRERFAFFFAPTTYPALPERLSPPEADQDGKINPDELAAWREAWTEHTAIYDGVDLIRALPLDPTARLLIAVYLDLRRRALEDEPLSPDLPSAGEDRPLFVTRNGEGAPVRPFGSRDVTDVIDRVNEARRYTRPDAPPVTRPRLRRAAVSHLLARGLGPIAVHTVTGRHLPGVRAPLFYTLINSDDLTASYHQAVGSLCDDLGAVYQEVRPESAMSALPWETGTPPQPTAACRTRHYGAIYHPRTEHVHAVVQAMLENARHPPGADVDDPADLERARHDALTTLTCYLLTLFAGLRVGEVAAMRRLQIDLFGDDVALAGDTAGLVVVDAKDDRFYEEYRVLPVPQPLAPLLKYMLARAARVSGCDDPHDPAFWFYRGRDEPMPLRRRHLWDSIDGVARHAGLAEGAPRWHSARHFLRTFLYRRGLDKDVIDYALGHRAEGAEPGNPYVDSDIQVILAAYQEATWTLVEKLELDVDGLW